MYKCLLALLALVLTPVTGLLAQEPTPPPQEPPATEVPAAPAPVRVVGQPQTQEELDAWTAIQQAGSSQSKIQLAEQFLQTYPDSGLSSYVYYTMASVYRQTNDIEKFVEFGEQALVELPELPDILAYLSFFYSEQGQTFKAEEKAQKALETLNTVKKPEEVSHRQWATQKFELSGEAHYALGRINLTRSEKVQGERKSEMLNTAAEHMVQSLEQSPGNPYAAFRLGEVYTRLDQYEKAIEAYARGVAIGGVIGDYARTRLETVYEHVHSKKDGMEDVIAKEKTALEAAQQEREQMIDQIVAEAEAAATPAEEPAAPAITGLKPPRS